MRERESRCVSLNAKYVHCNDMYVPCTLWIGCQCVCGCVCECRLKIKDLCSIVFYVWLVKWSFFVTSRHLACICTVNMSVSMCAKCYPFFFFFVYPRVQCRRCHVAYRHLLFAMFFDIFHLNLDVCSSMSMSCAKAAIATWSMRRLQEKNEKKE